MRMLYQGMIITLCLCICNACVASQSGWYFTSSDVSNLHSKQANDRIPYGNDRLQFGDLRLPDSAGPYPVAILIHGGCWISKFANIRNTSALADALRDIGIATWNIEYRRVDNEGGGWPGTFEDVAHAADFLNKIANTYSLDLNRVIVIGHSAGGHLALWLAARHQLSPNDQLYMQRPLPLQGVIVLGGIPDLNAFREQGKNTCDADVVGMLLGNAPEQIEKRYKQASPSELLPLGVRQILIYGTEDQSVPKKLSDAYIHSAQKKGDNVQLITVKCAAHHEYIVPNSIAWPAVKQSVMSLLSE